jgi:predicted lipoprotein with Yx(FWY)xxD motif
MRKRNLQRRLLSRAIARSALAIAPVGAALALGACGGASHSGSAASSPQTAAGTNASRASVPASPVASTTSAVAASSRAAVLNARSSRYGRVLFDTSGRALYLFASDRGQASTCYGACAQAWPPFTVTRAPKTGSGVRSGLVGVTHRRDGTLQVTYAGHPLYYFTGDTKPGQITCQNVSNFGGLWLVVTPGGKAVI